MIIIEIIRVCRRPFYAFGSCTSMCWALCTYTSLSLLSIYIRSASPFPSEGHRMVIVTRPRDVTDPFYRSNSTDYTQAYHSILRAARSGYSHASSSTSSTSSHAAPVLLLVSTDIDAICAARALVSLLTDDEVPYKLCPVDGYSTLSRIVEDDVETNETVS
jgi:hypothetical protein